MLDVRWGDRLESLADDLFGSAVPNADPFVPECVVVGSPVIKGWLKQHFLFDRRATQRVLANWEFVPLHQFVNDWLARMKDDPGLRRPALHPYSKECLRWRIYRLLETGGVDGLDVLRRYIGAHPKVQARRRFGLAGQLARMFDDYQNYRAETLVAWEAGRMGGLDPGLRWQRTLWNALRDEDAESYLAQFLAMDEHLPGKAIAAAYRRVSVFHVSSMPPPYLHFFELLAERTPVTVYAFNPSCEEWFGDLSPRQQERARLRGAPALMGKMDPDPLLNAGNPLLGGLGKGCQSYLSELLDRTDGQPAGDEPAHAEAGVSLLARVQAQIRDRVPSPVRRAVHPPRDPSVQFHVCHSPMREVEVLRDQLLAWFADNPGRQPRHVQVLVADLDTYAPFVDAVFQTDMADACDTIPYEIADRPKPGAGPLGLAYLALLRCCESRFTATELMGLLELDGIREAFGLAAGQVDVLRELVVESGIRWGADGEHLRSELGTDMDDVATWRRGLDRMLLGYATGRDARTREPRLVEAGALSNLRACDGVEGDSARWVGTLGRFFDAVRETAFRFRHPCGPAAWTERLQDVLDTFFRSTDATFAELAEIRSAIRLVGQTAAAAGEAALPYDVIAAAVEAQLHAAVPAATATSNKVLFTPLRTMRPTPRPLLYLLGMTEGVFPRRDDRPTFDLMACARRRGDRSLRLDDRLAFLETLMCARERLVVSYPGCSQKDNESVPPSTVVSELRQYLDDVFRSEGADHKPATPYLVVRHRLQAFHPAYFAAGGDLSSYSKTDFEAAVALRGREAQRHAAGVPSPRDVSQRAMAPVDADPAAPLGLGARPVLALADLQSFFLNPAKAFYVQALQAKLDDPADGVLCDTETLDSEGLGSYQMNEFLLRRALSGGTQEDTVSLLREQGLLPLGTPGDVLAESRQKGLRSFLDATCPETATTIRHVLMAEAEGSETPLLFHGVNVDVAGSVRTVDIEGTRYHVRARYAALKPKDRLKAWIAHLLGHAADGASFTSVVIGQGKDARGAISETLPARPCNAAANLQTLLTLWQAGAARVLPFAPATSYAYADALRKAAGKDADPQEATLQKARDAWHSEHARGDDQDAYLFQVWGIDGPMADPAFAELARAVWDSFLESCSPSNEDDGGEG